jgi:hypothetical protein
MLLPAAKAQRSGRHYGSIDRVAAYLGPGDKLVTARAAQLPR